MSLSTDYEVLHTYDHSPRTRIQRARRHRDGLTVLIKTHVSDIPSLRESEALRAERDVLARLQGGPVPRLVGLLEEGTRHLLTVEDRGHRAFSTETPLAVEPFLQSALGAARALAHVHAHHLVHRDVNPSNLLVHPEDPSDVLIIDFGISLDTTSGARDTVQTELIGTLAYLSPEQTGRTEHGVDERADLYALGVTFYELLCAQLPFQAEDTLGWVHAHLSRTPPPLETLRSGVPPTLARLIHRLLEKDPARRYQSAASLQHDLERCLRSWREEGAIPPFELGTQDHASGFELAEALLERDAALAQIDAHPAGTILAVEGGEGVGKSALLQRFQARAEREGVVVALVRCEEARREEPLAALSEALGQLARALLTGEERELTLVARRLQSALGAEAQVLRDLVPHFQPILGSGEPLPALPPRETIARRDRVFLCTMSALLEARPLALCFDDAHHMDPLTAELLSLMCESDALTSAGLRLITARRPDPPSPVRATTTRLPLEPLSREGVQAWIESSFKDDFDREGCGPLARLVFEKTEGRPLFVRDLFTRLTLGGMCARDEAQGVWCFDLEAIAALPIQEGALDGVMARLEQLPLSAREVLEAASCVGERFTTSRLLALCEGRDAGAIDSALERAVEARLVRRCDLAQLTFTHPHIQQAIHRALSPERRAEAHASIARVISSVDDDCLAQGELPALTHLREGVRHDASLHLLLARAEARAARRARQSAAYMQAASHYANALDALALAPSPEEPLRFELALSRVESLYAAGALPQALEECEALLAQTSETLARLMTLRHKAAILSLMGDLPGVIATGCEGAGLVELTLTADPEALKPLVGSAFARLHEHLDTHPIEDIPHLPEMSDPRYRAVLDLLGQVIPAAFYLNPPLFLLVELTMFDLSVRFGVTPMSGLCVAGTAVILTNAFADFDRAVAMGEAAEGLMARYSPHVIESSVNFVRGTFLHPLRHELSHSLRAFDRAFEIGSTLGDVEHAAYASAIKVVYAQIGGTPLEEVIALSQHAATYCAEVGSRVNHYSSVLYGAAAAALRGDATKLLELETSLQEKLAAAQRPDTTFAQTFYQLLVHAFWSGDLERAVTIASQAQPTIALIHGMALEIDFHFYAALAHALLAQARSGEEREALFAAAEAAQAKFAPFAAQNPSLFGPMARLLDAELAPHRGQDDLCRVDLYRDVISSAGGQLLQWRAFANERHAALWIAREHVELARACIQQAFALHERWGCTLKLESLRHRHPTWCTRSTPERHATTRTQHGRHTAQEKTQHAPTLTTSIGLEEQLDMDSVLKATQAISSEVKAERLFAALMNTLMENAGAQRAALLLVEEGKLWLHARVESDGDQSFPHLPLAALDDLALQPITLCARTREEVLLGDARKHELFQRDAYIASAQLSSVLCVPVLQAGELLGVLYLENALMPHAFTPRHSKLLRIIAGQAATSIQNVRVFEQLEARVQRRTRELAHRNREMQALFDLLPQGVLTLDAELRIEAGASHQVSALFEGARAGTSLIEALFSDTTLTAEQISATEMALRFSYGEPVFMCELNWDHLIRSFDRVEPDGSRRFFELDWVPIADEGEDVFRVLLTVRDVTELRRLERAAQENEREFKILQQIFKAGLAPFSSYHQQAIERLEQSRALIEHVAARAPLPSSTLDVVFRNLHTLKGNARVLGLSTLSSVIHQAEEPIPPLRLDAEDQASRQALTCGIEEVSALLEEHARLLREVVGEQQAEAPMASRQLEALRQVLDEEQECAPEARLERARAVLRRADAVPLQGVVSEVARMFPSMSEALSKPVPHVEVREEEQRVLLEPKLAQTLNDALVHVFRNAFDHGIERPEERRSKGKEEAGRIELHVITEQGRRCVKILDDGRGLALEKLRQKLPANASDEEVAATIFTSGTSTAEQVSDISGRGVGMDAVRAFLEERGCEVHLEFTAPERDGYRPFALCLALPDALLVA